MHVITGFLEIWQKSFMTGRGRKLARPQAGEAAGWRGRAAFFSKHIQNILMKVLVIFGGKIQTG